MTCATGHAPPGGKVKPNLGVSTINCELRNDSSFRCRSNYELTTSSPQLSTPQRSRARAPVWGQASAFETSPARLSRDRDALLVKRGDDRVDTFAIRPAVSAAGTSIVSSDAEVRPRRPAHAHTAQLPACSAGIRPQPQPPAGPDVANDAASDTPHAPHAPPAEAAVVGATVKDTRP